MKELDTNIVEYESKVYDFIQIQSLVFHEIYRSVTD